MYRQPAFSSTNRFGHVFVSACAIAPIYNSAMPIPFYAPMPLLLRTLLVCATSSSKVSSYPARFSFSPLSTCYRLFPFFPCSFHFANGKVAYTNTWIFQYSNCTFGYFPRLYIHTYTTFFIGSSSFFLPFLLIPILYYVAGFSPRSLPRL